MLGHRTLNAEDYFTILKRRWWIICIPAVILPIAAVGVSYTVTPEYQSQALILIEQQKVPTDVVKATDTGDLQSRLALITEQIEARSTLEPIITKYNLYASQHLSMEARVDLMRNPKNLTIAPLQSQIGSSGLPGFKVLFTAEDPHTAQQVCADITGLYTGTDLRQRSADAEGTTAFEQSQLDEARHTLDDMDKKKAEFEEKNMGMLPGDGGNDANFVNSLGARLDATNGQIQNLGLSRSMLEGQLSQAAQTATPAAVTVRVEQADQKELETLEAQLADLQSHYTDDYPEVRSTKRQIEDLRAQIAKEAAAAPAPAAAHAVDSPEVIRLRGQIRAVDQQIELKTKEQSDIQAQMRSYEGKIQASPEVAEQYKELTRDYDTENALYDTLQAKLGQSKMRTELENRSEGETFNVLDAASLPIDAVYPKQSVFAMGGLGLGLMLGLLTVALLEYKDTALRTERDVWAFTQLPTLAVIAWSGDVAETQQRGRVKRLFSRKASKEALAG